MKKELGKKTEPRLSALHVGQENAPGFLGVLHDRTAPVLGATDDDYPVSRCRFHAGSIAQATSGRAPLKGASLPAPKEHSNSSDLYQDSFAYRRVLRFPA